MYQQKRTKRTYHEIVDGQNDQKPVEVFAKFLLGEYEKRRHIGCHAQRGQS